MPTIDAKSEFLKSQKASLPDVANLVTSPLMRTTMVFAFSQMAEMGATKEQLEGARIYRDLLLNLAEPPPEKPSFPQRQLKQE